MTPRFERMKRYRGVSAFSLQERIERLSIPEPNSGCWLWLGKVFPKDRPGPEYGCIDVGSRALGTLKTRRAHRVSYEAFVGPIPAGIEVCHSCDTPPCVNPSHLFLGTRQDNIDDRERKGRNKIMRGEMHGNSKFTDDFVKNVISSSGSMKDIADRFGISLADVKNLRCPRTWRHLK